MPEVQRIEVAAARPRSWWSGLTARAGSESSDLRRSLLVVVPMLACVGAALMALAITVDSDRPGSRVAEFMVVFVGLFFGTYIALCAICVVFLVVHWLLAVSSPILSPVSNAVALVVSYAFAAVLAALVIAAGVYVVGGLVGLINLGWRSL